MRSGRRDDPGETPLEESAETSAGPRLSFKSIKKIFSAHEVLQKPEKAVLIHTSEETKQKVDVSAKETVRSLKRKTLLQAL